MSGNTIATSTLLMVALRWTDRLIGLVSTLILARLLTPEDFGLVAMAVLVIGLVDIFTDLGVNVALIQRTDPEQAHFDSAWTMRAIQASLAAALVVLLAPQAAQYFGDDRVVHVLQLLAIGMVLVGIENIGVVTFQKEMRFGAEFRFIFSRRIFAFVVTVSAAFILRNYWALIIGMLSGRAFGVVLSYMMHPMRPRPGLQKWRDIFGVSQWMLIKSIGNYLNNNIDKLLVGRRSPTAVLGAYTLGGEIAAMPASEVLAPLNRVLFPAFVKVKHDLVELRRLYLLAQGIQVTLVVPASVGLALVAEDAVRVLLGERWLAAVPFLQLLALARVVEAISTSGGYLLITLGRIGIASISAWFQVFLFVAAAVLILPESAATQIAAIKVGVGSAALGLSIYLVVRTMPGLRLVHILGVVYRPLLATGLMTAAVLGVAQSAGGLHPAASLLIKATLGGATYGAGIVMLWIAVGRPAGAELYALEKLRGWRRSRRPTGPARTDHARD